MRLIARKPTKAELAEAMSNKPVYKVVRVEDSKFKSLWVKGTREKPDTMIVAGKRIKLFTLTYAEDMLSSNGRYGIWCCRTIQEAARQVIANGSGLCAVFVAYPVGKLIRTPSGWVDRGIALYPAIILGEKVAELEAGHIRMLFTK